MIYKFITWRLPAPRVCSKFLNSSWSTKIRPLGSIFNCLGFLDLWLCAVFLDMPRRIFVIFDYFYQLLSANRYDIIFFALSKCAFQGFALGLKVSQVGASVLDNSFDHVWWPKIFGLFWSYIYKWENVWWIEPDFGKLSFLQPSSLHLWSPWLAFKNCFTRRFHRLRPIQIINISQRGQSTQNKKISAEPKLKSKPKHLSSFLNSWLGFGNPICFRFCLCFPLCFCLWGHNHHIPRSSSSYQMSRWNWRSKGLWPRDKTRRYRFGIITD